MKRWLVLLAATVCLSESMMALGWMLYHGLRSGNTALSFGKTLLTVGQLSLFAVGLGMLVWARHRRPALISKREYVLTSLTVTCGAAACLVIFAIMTAGSPPPVVDLDSLPRDPLNVRARHSSPQIAETEKAKPEDKQTQKADVKPP